MRHKQKLAKKAALAFTVFALFAFDLFAQANYVNLVGWWPLTDNAAATTAENRGFLSGNGTFTNMDANDWAATLKGTAVNFNGDNTNERIQIADDTDLDLSTYAAFTIMAWARPETFDGRQYPMIFSHGDAQASLGFSDSEAGTEGRIEHWVDNTTPYHSTNAATLNEWHHYAVVHNQTANTVSFYIDGTLQNTVTSAADVTNNPTNGNAIGEMPINGTDTDFDGQIKDVRVYKVAATAKEIQEIVRARRRKSF